MGGIAKLNPLSEIKFKNKVSKSEPLMAGVHHQTAYLIFKVLKLLLSLIFKVTVGVSQIQLIKKLLIALGTSQMTSNKNKIPHGMIKFKNQKVGVPVM